MCREAAKRAQTPLTGSPALRPPRRSFNTQSQCVLKSRRVVPGSMLEASEAPSPNTSFQRTARCARKIGAFSADGGLRTQSRFIGAPPLNFAVRLAPVQER